VDDTRPEVRQLLTEGYRRMTPAEKLARVRSLTIGVQQLALAGIRARHPGISDREARLRLASLSLDRQTMIGAFDWDPDEHGRG
jgi:hypothetical protein